MMMNQYFQKNYVIGCMLLLLSTIVHTSEDYSTYPDTQYATGLSLSAIRDWNNTTALPKPSNDKQDTDTHNQFAHKQKNRPKISCPLPTMPTTPLAYPYTIVPTYYDPTVFALAVQSCCDPHMRELHKQQRVLQANSALVSFVRSQHNPGMQLQHSALQQLVEQSKSIPKSALRQQRLKELL